MKKKQDQIEILVQDGANNILSLIKEYISKNAIDKSPVVFVEELQTRIREEVNASLYEFIEAMETRDDNQLALEFAENIFDVMEALTQNGNIEDKHLQEILVTGQTSANKELIQTFIESHKEKETFIQKLTNKLKEGSLINKNELTTLRDYRQTSEARKDVKRVIQRQVLSIDDSIIQKFLSDVNASTKAEVLVRLEKYIESGWYEIDQPLKEYKAGGSMEGNVFFAVESLKLAMQNRFNTAKFERIIEREDNLQFDKFAIDVSADRKSSILSLARAGEKDFCITSADGKKILMGDVTTEETGEWNKNSWLNGLRAAKDFEKANNIEVDYSVTIISLFYDEKEQYKESDIKAKFLNKLKKHDQKFINDFHFLQFISVLSRDTINFEYNPIELMNNVKVNFIGSSSDMYCNKALKLKGADFIENTFNIIENISDQLINNRKVENGNVALFDGGIGSMTAEGIPIRVLLNAISGLSIIVLEHPEFEERYKALSDRVAEIQEAITANSDLYMMAVDTGRKVLTLDYDKKQRDMLRKKYQTFKSLKLEREEKEHALLINNGELLEKSQGSIISLIKDMKIFISSFPNMNDEIDKMRKNKSALIDREVMIDLMIAISKFTEDPSSQKKLISTQPSFKKEALNGIVSPRSVLFKFTQAFNNSYGKNAVALYKNLDLTLNEMKILVNNTEKYIDGQCNKASIQMARKNIDGLKDKSTHEIKEHLAVRVNEVNEFLSSLLVNIQSQKEQIESIVNIKVAKKRNI